MFLQLQTAYNSTIIAVLLICMKFEQGLMFEARYRGLAQHKLEHQQFVDRLMEVRLPFTDSFIAEAKHWYATLGPALEIHYTQPLLY